MTEFYLKLVAVIGAVLVPVIYVLWGPSTVTVQRGYEGLAMDHVYNRDVLGKTYLANDNMPPTLPPGDPSGKPAAEIYENVQVLGSLSAGQFNRIMASMTLWVAGEKGCNYCHNPQNMASDEVYTKHVARRMLQMTQHINENWQKHVGQTGVTCWTCHRGKPVPEYVWYKEPINPYAFRALGNPAEQNIAGDNVTYASLPNDPFTPFLEKDANIRVVGPTPLPTGNRASIKQMEWTYGLMIHMSNALGVNCTYCHNSRAFAEWKQSPPARSTAWHGIRMVRDINNEYTAGLLQYYPDYRIGPTGDAPKANCKTCHQGAYKPMLGAQMAKDFPELQKSTMYVPPKDTDGDGLFDDDDQCISEPETMNGFKDSDGCADEVPEDLKDLTGVIEGIDFSAGNERISRNATRVLDSAIRILGQYPELKIEVGVHSDNMGEADANQTLTQQRADLLREYLSSRGLGDRVTAVGYGASRPLGDNETADGRSQNRRVEFKLD